ncbi:MAG: hypothetical protein AAGK78_03195 [Planctomycetota bacterium]
MAARFPLTRRSGKTSSDPRAVVLVDTMGELRLAYALADLVIVGRSLADLGEKQHGSDMIEPAALGKPVIVGPFTGNFAEPMNLLRHGDAIVESGASELKGVVLRLLSDASRLAELGGNGREVVTRSRGATAQTVSVIRRLLRD